MKIVSLDQNGQFQRLYRRGKSVVTPTMVVYALPNRMGRIRLGITAGKKVGGAVLRNRAKRRIRELFRTSLANIRPGTDICSAHLHGARPAQKNGAGFSHSNA